MTVRSIIGFQRTRRAKSLRSENYGFIGRPFWIVFLVLFLFTSCAARGVPSHRRMVAEPCKVRAPIQEIRSSPAKEDSAIENGEKVRYGIASWYGPDFHGRQTASGAIYDMYAFTAAHPSLPMGTYVMVTNLSSNLSTEVIINDRGPFVKRRVIDLSYCAAVILGIIDKGTAKVRLEILDKGLSASRASFIRVENGYTIQVASFSREDSAVFLKEKLLEDFPDTRIASFQSTTQRFYRVRIGEFSERSGAMEVAEKLVMMGYNVDIISLNK